MAVIIFQVSDFAAGEPISLISAPNAVDFVDDTAHNILYISSGSQVLRYDFESNAFLSPFNLGGNLSGIDLSPDGTHLLVADSSYTSITGWFYDIDTATGTKKKITYSHKSREGGAYQIRIASDGTALLTAKAAYGSGCLPIRQYNLETESLTVVSSSIYQNALLSASADRSVVAITERGASPTTILRYRAATKDFVSGRTPCANLYSTGAAVNRDGSQIISSASAGTSIYDQNWNLIEKLDRSQIEAPIGMVYDSSKDVLYVAEINTTHIDAYNTNTWQKIDSYNIPDNFTFATGSGRLRTSNNGNYLYVLSPGSGIYAIQVPEPSTITLLLICGICFFAFKWRKL